MIAGAYPEDMNSHQEEQGMDMFRSWMAGMLLIGLLGTAQDGLASGNGPNTVRVADYDGWTNALVLNNGLVEAVIVPAAGRVLQFRFAGGTNGPFWENSNLFGATATAASWNTEGSFGGDKAWPSPQSDWNWPPPSGFDGSPNFYAISNGTVTLTTPVDSTYKIVTTRVIELAFDQPVMRIKTIFKRGETGSAAGKKLGIWVITQAQDPVRVYVQARSPSIFANGYHLFDGELPKQYRDNNNLVSFTRDSARAHKLGFDADSVAWVGPQLSLRIDAPRVAAVPDDSYPDGGCDIEVYTNPNAPYVELECLGPLSLLPAGGQIEFVTSYTLFHRSEADPDAEAKKVLNLAGVAH
jgi:hypothetical protein